MASDSFNSKGISINVGSKLQQWKCKFLGRVMFFLWAVFTAWLLFVSLYATISNKSELIGIGRSRLLGAMSHVVPSVSEDSSIVTSAVEESNPHHLSQKGKKVKLMKLTKLNSIAKVASQLKIFVYDMPHGYNINALKLLRKSPQHYKHFFGSSADLYFHQRLMHASTLYTSDPEEADYFLVPIYTSALVLINGNTKTSRDKTRKILIKGLKRVKKMPYWKRYGGRDHIFIFPHSFGSCIGNPYDEFRKESDLHTSLMNQIGNSIFLTYDAQPYDNGEILRPCYDPEKDIVIPPVVNVERMRLILTKSKAGKRIINSIKKKTYKRTQLLLMTGRTQLEQKGDPWFAIVVLYGPYQDQTMRPKIKPSKGGCWRRPDLSLEECVASCDAELSRGRVFSRGVRQKIHTMYQRDPRYKHVRSKNGISEVVEMKKSIFCLGPRGISSWNTETYAAAVLGCIPLVVADDVPLPFEKFLPYDNMILSFRESHFSRILLRLSKIKKISVRKMQKYLALHRKAFTYTPLKYAVKTKEFWSRLNTLDLQGDETIGDLIDSDQYHGPDAFEYAMMELALKKMENRHRKGIGAQMYKEAKAISPARKSNSMIDYLFKPVPHRERIANKFKTKLQKTHKIRQSRVLKFASGECARRVRFKRVQQYIISKRSMKTGNQALVFQGRIGDNAKSINVIMGQWKKETAGTVLSELDITMSLSIAGASWEELHRLEKTAKSWGGYLSVGIVATGDNSIGKIAEKIRSYEFKHGGSSSKILFSIVSHKEGKDTNLYPANRARNAALANVLTQNVLLWENGVLLSDESKYALRRSQKSILTWNERTAIVVPTFEFTTSTFAGKGIPATKHNLVWNIKNEELQPYGMVGDAFKYYTHATKNDKWYESSTAMYAEYEVGYQPLILVRMPVVPFDETFSGTYLGRMHHTFELFASGYSFLVHPTAFGVTIDAGVAARIQADADMTGSWTVPWSCWRQFTDRIEKEYEGFVFPEPCWLSKEVWPAVNQKHGMTCAQSISN